MKNVAATMSRSCTSRRLADNASYRKNVCVDAPWMDSAAEPAASCLSNNVQNARKPSRKRPN